MTYFVSCGYAPQTCYFLRSDKIPDRSDVRKEGLILAHSEGTVHHGGGDMELGR